MRELTAYEIEEVSGGFVWYLACGIGVAAVLAGSYLLGKSHGVAGVSSNYTFMGVKVTATQCTK